MSVIVRKLLFLSFILSGSLSVFSQQIQDNPALPLNKPVSVEQLKMKSYEKDTSADAVVLYDYGNATFIETDHNYLIRYEYVKRIKILKKSGVNKANAKIFLYNDKASGRGEQIYKISGITYNMENGSIVTYEMSKDARFVEKEDEYFEKVSFTLPQVKEGSVIDIAYTIESPFPFKPKNWYFQGNAPVITSEYIFSAPRNFSYRVINQGLAYITTNKDETSKEYQYYHWIAENIPAINPEPYLTTLNDYVSSIHFELAEYWVNGMPNAKSFTTTWPNLDKELLYNSYFWGELRKVGFLDEYTKSIRQISPADTLARAKAAYAFIQQNMNWNGEMSKYTENTSLKNAFSKKQGSSAEINLMLTGLLQDLGINANPVILSTRDHGKVWKDFPLITRFNYVIAHVNIGGEDILLDATSQLLSFGMLPEHCLNGEGRIIAKRNSRWIPITPNEKSVKFTTTNFNIDPSNASLEGTINVSGLGYNALNFRENVSQNGKAKFVESLKKNQPLWENPSIELKDFEFNQDSVKTPKIIIKTKINDAVGTFNEKILLNPMLGEELKSNPFINPNRTYPVDIAYLREENFSGSYKLPEGYVVDEMPKSIRIAMPNDAARFTYIVSEVNGILNVSCRVHLKKTFFAVEEYGTLREFYSQIVAKQAEKIVLKKK